MLHLFIGWDPNEQDAYKVAAHSAVRRSSLPLVVHPVKERPLRQEGLYTRPYSVTASGQRVDGLDGKPFSTEFSFTRFLVPHIARKLGLSGQVLFCDGDFLFLSDLADLFRDTDQRSVVSVVKHNYLPLNNSKMDGQSQEQYRRKLWSSLMMFNLDHPRLDKLDAEYVNTHCGQTLHHFDWVGDDLIGEIDERWNWIPGASPTIKSGFHWAPNAVHFTEGVPYVHPNKEKTPFAEDWLAEYEHLMITNPMGFR